MGGKNLLEQRGTETESRAKGTKHSPPKKLPFHVVPESRVCPSTKEHSNERGVCKAEEKQMYRRLLWEVGQEGCS